MYRTPPQISRARANPALRARAAVNGMVRSNSTTSAPQSCAIATDRSLEPESTYTIRAGPESDLMHRARRFPSLRPITTAPKLGAPELSGELGIFPKEDSGVLVSVASRSVNKVFPTGPLVRQLHWRMRQRWSLPRHSGSRRRSLQCGCEHQFEPVQESSRQLRYRRGHQFAARPSNCGLFQRLLAEILSS